MAIVKLPTADFEVNGEKVSVNFNLMDMETRDLLEERVLEVRKKQSIYYKYPFEEGETNEKWSERVSKEVEQEYARKEGELVEDHLKRMFNTQDGKNVVIDIFNAVALTFANKEFDAKQLKKCNWFKLRAFLYDVLTYCDIAANDLKSKELGK